MGSFSICVEATARNVNALLELHKVHPQVRGDVRKHLNTLVDKSFAHEPTMEPGHQESAEKVCRAIATQLVHKALTIAVPRAEVAALQRENAALRQRAADLAEEVKRAEARSAAGAETLERFQTAHDYVLHSYFREVLILRHRIRDLERRNKAKHAASTALAGMPWQGGARRSLPLSSPGRAQPSDLGSTNPFRDAEAVAEARPSLWSPSTVDGNGSASLHAASTDSPAAMLLGVPAPPSAEAPDGTEEAPAERVLGELLAQWEASGLRPAPARAIEDGPARTESGGHAELQESCEAGRRSPAATATQRGSGAASSAGHSAASLLSTSHAPITHAGGASAARDSETPVAVSPSAVSAGMQTPALPAEVATERRTSGQALSSHDMLQVIAGAAAPPEEEAESVDAIFDYEEYLALLNGGESSMEQQRMRLAMGVEGAGRQAAQELPHRSRRLGAGQLRRGDDFTLNDDVLLSRMAKELDYYKTRASKMQWCLDFAVRPVKFELADKLTAIRQEVVTMQRTFKEFFETMSDLMTLLQSRSDALVDLFSLFTTEVLHLLASMNKDAAAKNCAELFLNSGKRRNKLEAIFTAAVSTRAAQPQPMTGNATELTAAPALQRYAPWQSHPVVGRARGALALLEKLSDTLRRKRAFLLSKGGELVEQGYRSLFHRRSGGRAGSAETGDGGRSRVSITWAQTLEDSTAPTPHDASQPHLSTLSEGTGEDGSGGEGGDSSLRSATRWRSALVEDASLKGEQVTGLALVEELLRLRMRRACNRVRRSHTVNQILDIEYAREEGIAQGDAESWEQRHKLLSDICEVYERSMRRETRRIRELLALLARHMRRCGAVLSPDMAAALTLDGDGDGEESDADARRTFYASPYLYDRDAFAKASLSQPRHNHLLYVPVGTSADSYVIFQNEHVPISSFAGAGEMGSVGPAVSPRTYGEIRTPYGAAVDYCCGVQRGMPVGDHFGPVFLQQQQPLSPTGEGTGDYSYYIADERGRDLLRAAEDAARRGFTTTAELRGEGRMLGADGTAVNPPLSNPATLPMTQILFPAPQRLAGPTPASPAEAPDAPHPYTYHTDTTPSHAADGHPAHPATSSSSLPSASPGTMLRPIYLVPLTTPATTREQVRTGLGHTAASQLFSVPPPAPARQDPTNGSERRAGEGHLAVSLTHLLDPTGGAAARWQASTSAARVCASSATAKATNPYLHEPPRVCRPPTEEQQALRIESLQWRLADAAPSPPPSQQQHHPSAAAAERLTPASLATAEDDGDTLQANDDDTLVPVTAPSGGADESPSTPPLASFESALRRAKQQRAARVEREALQQAEAAARRQAAWTQRVANPTEMGSKEKFLRLRLPGSGRLAPIKPSAQATAMLQRKTRLPALPAPSRGDGGGEGSGSGGGVVQELGGLEKRTEAAATTSSAGAAAAGDAASVRGRAAMGRSGAVTI